MTPKDFSVSVMDAGLMVGQWNSVELSGSHLIQAEKQHLLKVYQAVRSACLRLEEGEKVWFFPSARVLFFSAFNLFLTY